MEQGNFKVKEVSKGKIPRWQQYAALVVGKTELLSFLKYEIITFFLMNLPGALGLYLRSKFYPLILGEVGSKVVFGRGVTLRHPHKIRIGENVIIDDNCVLDAKGQSNSGISLGDGVFVGRNSIIYCKDGDIEIQPQVNIGANCQIYSKCLVKIGKGTMIAAYNCILSGGRYDYKSEVPLAEQSSYTNGPTLIGEGCWLGTKAVVLDGLSIGDRTVVGAGAVVTKDLPAGVVAMGVPAKVREQVCS
ncbi:MULTISPECIES: acyltransferase [Moorena]|uniref:Acyltransferase n=1 Tax=Moorena producens (strain JHB) TaxID=1454205 RepID=A0A1D9FXN3_MOOP1|nr:MULTISPECIES: acyltransferase [Moorena]AOY80055.1 acyltransferase [Moorena producens JHB]NEP34883.1 acyltransferase [Moorena sp. SIO3B2]NET64588.1 acyltransferase [Moorena sp. SIO1G6]